MWRRPWPIVFFQLLSQHCASLLSMSSRLCLFHLSPRNNVAFASCLRSPSSSSSSSVDLLLHRLFHQLDSDGDGLVTVDDLTQLLINLNLLHSSAHTPHHHELPGLIGLLAPYASSSSSNPAQPPGCQLDWDQFQHLYRSLDQPPSPPSSSSSLPSSVAVHEHTLDDETLEQAFQVFDLDGNGFIDATELQQVLTSMGFQQCQDLAFCNSILERVDSNSDGLIDLSDFHHMMN